jgi:lipoprotein-anchoring transpeptidase ErfK/SrfK
MKLLQSLTLAALLVSTAIGMEKPSAHTQGTPTGRPTGQLKPGEYWWRPQISPSGPVLALVSIPLQTMHVYRNGILIGRSTVSTGSPGHSTPSGVFTILEKKTDHYSKKYDNAPMPNMQRLTWSGICMHSGNLPGYPASHGCIRMPYDFSRNLFEATAKGGTVVISDGKTSQPHLAANPGVMLAPKDLSPDMVRPLPVGGYDWRPERSTVGPVTILISGKDRMLYVYRNGNPIGRASVAITGRGPLGGSVFTMLDGVKEKPSWWAPNRQARKWMRVTSDETGRRADIDDLGRRLQLNPEFATKLYDAVGPGTTVIITDQPAIRKADRNFTILTN